MRTLAVVGMGSIAKRHLANLRALHPDAKIFAVSSSGRNTTLPENADALINLRELITYKPDYVILASPAPYHVGVAQELVASNISVLIEKPLADSVDSCVALKDFCESKPGSEVAVGYCLRFLPSAIEVKNYIEQGFLGTIYNVNAVVGQYLPNWRSGTHYKKSVSANKALGGGVLFELSHELDYLIWMLGDLSLQHSFLRITDELELDVEDIANLVLLGADDVYVSVHLDFIQKSTHRRCEFIGQHGRLVWDLIGNTVTLYHGSGRKTLYADPDYNKNKMYMAMLTAFENQLVGQQSSLATISSATEVVQLIEGAKQLNKWGHKA